MSEFFAMGGNAVFVWPSYGLLAVAVGWNIWVARQLRLRAEEEIRDMEGDE